MIVMLIEKHIESAFSIIQDVICSMKIAGINQWDEIYPDKKLIQNDILSGQAFGYFDNKEIAGYIAINNEYPLEYNTVNWNISGRALFVHRLAVKTEKQGEGIGTEMMLFAVQYAKDNFYNTIRLDSFVNNPAANILYKKLGFLNAGTVEFRNGLFNCYEKQILST